MTYSGVVLAGGRSSRFRRDKAEYVFKGKPLMARVLESLSGAGERFIVANRPYPAYEVPVYPDLIPVRSPLSGVHAALTYAEHDWVAVAACDLPYLTAAYWQTLASYRAAGEAVVVRLGGRLEPLAAFYHKRCLDRAEEGLQQSVLALHAFIEGLEAIILPWEALGLPQKTLTNVNTQDDLV